jgi:hypothetical protein
MSGDRDGSVFKNSNWDLSNDMFTDDDDSNKKHLQDVINRIQESDGNLYGQDKYLEYSIILDDISIRKIRDYNNSNKNYSDINTTNDTGVSKTLYDCTKSDGKYFECQSSFLDKLSVDFSVNVIKDDGESKYTKCKNNPSSEGCGAV